MAHRQLVLVDIENLVGTAHLTADDIASVRATLTTHLDLRPGDLVVVGSSHHAYEVAGFAWQGVRHVVRSGPNGADLALLDVLTADPAAQRVDRVVIASGDGIFTEAAARLAHQGVTVVAIANHTSMSKRLRLAVASTLRYDTQLSAVATPGPAPMADIATVKAATVSTPASKDIA